MIEGAVAAGAGLLSPVVAGPALAYAIERLPRQWRRTTEWIVIGGGALLAVAADLWSAGPVSGAIVYILAALPGLITFLVWRSLLATTVVSCVPLYFVISIVTRSGPLHAPEMALDRLITVQPAWMLVYASLYVFVILLPLLVVREPDLIRRAMQAYLTVMIVAYIGFLVYPTGAPRPGGVPGDGFAAWALRLAYAIDVPYNCFPSLHVAYAFVSALTCYRVHRGVGAAATVWAALIGVSTLYTKQHYVADVIAGALIALVAYAIFLRGHRRNTLSERETRRAPVRALIAAVAFAATVAGCWVVYRVAPADRAAQELAAVRGTRRVPW